MAERDHCQDCCCAQSWAALGVEEYTGKSIPEHIAALKAELTELRTMNRKLWESLTAEKRHKLNLAEKESR